MDVFGFGQPAAPPSRESLLVTAASRGNLDRVTCLLDDEVKVVKVTELVNGFNALHSAAKKNHISIVELLVRRHPSLISCRTEDERTAEMVAAFEGHADLLSILRNEIVGESPVSFTEECTDSKKNTSLHYAAWGGSLECVKFLVETCKMNPAAKNLEGMTAVQFASAGNHALIVAYLSSVSNQGEDNNISSESGYNSLHRACIYGAVDTVNYLLQSKQIDCDSVSGSGSTALHIACQNGQLAIVKMLIEVYEADYDVQNNYGLTPLHSACASNYPEVASLLLQHSANPQLTTSSGATALHLAAASGSHEICKKLADMYIVDLTAEDDEHHTAIDAALNSGYKELASKLAYWDSMRLRIAALTEDVSLYSRYYVDAQRQPHQEAT